MKKKNLSDFHQLVVPFQQQRLGIENCQKRKKKESELQWEFCFLVTAVLFDNPKLKWRIHIHIPCGGLIQMKRPEKHTQRPL